jgi:hypothetical protein
VDDRARRLLVEEELDQDTPQESLFVLRHSFTALRSIIDQLLAEEGVTYQLYSDLGTLLLREIVLNRYFRPFRPLEFRLEYDRIKSAAVLDALTVLESEDRTLFTVAFLGVFRLLHYLAYVTAPDSERPTPKDRLLLALVRSEAMSLAGYLQTDLCVRASQKRYKAAGLRLARDIQRACQGADAPAAVNKSAAELLALFQGQLGTLYQALSPQGTASTAAELLSRVTLASRLRQDLWLYAEICSAAARALRESEADLPSILERVLRFNGHFQVVSYQLLRFGDYAPFDAFSQVLDQVAQGDHPRLAQARLGEQCKLFAQTVKTTFAAVSRRRDLRGQPFEVERARALLSRFWAP